jgi:hypothetical protein
LLLKNLFLTSFIAALLLCLSAPASAEVSIGYAQDVVHAPETGAAIVRYDHEPTRLGGQAMYWDGPDHHNMSLGLDYDLIPSKTVDLNLGGVFIKNVNGINGTHFNFSIGLGVNLGKYARVQFSHFSNGRSRNNDGWNFVGILLRL